MITTLDITRLDDFANFLQIHLSCFVLMQSRASEPCLSTATLSDMIAERYSVGQTQDAPVAAPAQA